jgi:hypothetical protein
MKHDIILRVDNKGRVVAEGNDQVKYLERMPGVSYSVLAQIRARIAKTKSGYILGRLEEKNGAVYVTAKNRKGLLWKLGSTIGVTDSFLQGLFNEAKAFGSQAEWGAAIANATIRFGWNHENPMAFYNHLTPSQRIGYYKFRTEVIDKLPK